VAGDLIILSSLVTSSVVFYPDVKDCSDEMAEVPMMYMVYFGWFIIRQLFTFLACWWTNKPADYAFGLRLCFLCTDGIALSVVVIKSIVIMTS
jgi:hypothetical protein